MEQEKSENIQALLEELDLVEESRDWTAEQWVELLSNKFGVITHQEFISLLTNEIDKYYIND